MHSSLNVIGICNSIVILRRSDDTRGDRGTWPMFGYRGAADRYKNLTLSIGQKRPKIPTLSRTSPSILGPCLGQIKFNDDNRATLPRLGQIQNLFRADSRASWNFIPCSEQRDHKPYPVQRQDPV